MDNRVFNVNGKGKEFLTEVLTLAFKQRGANTKAEGWMFSPDHGFIIMYHGDGPDFNKFPVPLLAEDIAAMIYTWINTSPDAKAMVCSGWDADYNHDGHNSAGWRVYCEDWGHVNGNWGAICAVRPAFMWHGK